MDLDAMKYAELQRLGKELGLKANVKADKLLKAIKQHYEMKAMDEEGQKDAPVQEDENGAQDNAQGSKEASCKEDVSKPSVFVNTRRGKGNRTKRKTSDTATVTECDESSAEGDAEVAASGPVCGAKKTQESSTSDSEEMDTEPSTEPPVTSSQQQHGSTDKLPLPCDTGNAPKVVKAGKIPRYKGQKKTALLKPVTPNFKKIHEAHFNKMESLDSYVHRKTKKMETYKNPVRELKRPADKKKLRVSGGKTQAKANVSRVSMFSPVPVNKRPAEDKHKGTLLPASKAPPTKLPRKDSAAFRPSVISTRRINVRFSEATHDNEHKKSLLKTPARMSLCVTTSTPKNHAGDGAKPSNVKTSALSATKTPGPFIFTGNTSFTPGTQKKPNFDLKASLSRPLNYQPHTGKLKPFGAAKENATGNKSLISNSRQKNYKQHQVETRDVRREKHIEDRKQKKANVLGARRGLVMM